MRLTDVPVIRVERLAARAPSDTRGASRHWSAAAAIHESKRL
jgi:hypothetical protein